jgi:hypothetical protein
MRELHRILSHLRTRSVASGVPFAYPRLPSLAKMLGVEVQQIERLARRLEQLGAIRVGSPRDDAGLQDQIEGYEAGGLLHRSSGHWRNVYWVLCRPEQLDELLIGPQTGARHRPGGRRRRRRYQAPRRDQPELFLPADLLPESGESTSPPGQVIDLPSRAGNDLPSRAGRCTPAPLQDECEDQQQQGADAAAGGAALPGSHRQSVAADTLASPAMAAAKLREAGIPGPIAGRHAQLDPALCLVASAHLAEVVTGKAKTRQPIVNPIGLLRAWLTDPLGSGFGKAPFDDGPWRLAEDLEERIEPPYDAWRPPLGTLWWKSIAKTAAAQRATVSRADQDARDAADRETRAREAAAREADGARWRRLPQSVRDRIEAAVREKRAGLPTFDWERLHFLEMHAQLDGVGSTENAGGASTSSSSSSPQRGQKMAVDGAGAEH